jgi:GH43 family beta-xylosidase
MTIAVASAAPLAGSASYINPLLDSGPDPWVLQVDGTYYYTHTLGNRIALWRTRDLGALARAEMRVVWYPPPAGPDAHSIWAPELHRFDGRWFIYYSATASGFKDDAHRGVFVLENDSADPLTGQWISRGRVNTAHPGIDGTVFTSGGARYFVYSPYIGPRSALAIARMENPWALAGGESVIARPDLPWEQRDGREILEGPAFLRGPRGDLFLTYSAAPCWSDDYAIGLLHAARGADPLDPKSWRKLSDPVLRKGNGVYATGHNGFFASPDGRENWIIYHANSAPGMKCTAKRAPHIQRFRWTRTGWPRFGSPAGTGRQLPAPGIRHPSPSGR